MAYAARTARPARPSAPERAPAVPAASAQRTISAARIPSADAGHNPRPGPRTENGADSAAQDSSGARRPAGTLPPEVALALARYFDYPRAARALGIEGEVRVRFAVSAAGAVAPSGLAHSSGHALLDRAALAGLDRLARAERLPAHLRGTTVELPVQYRLER